MKDRDDFPNPMDFEEERDEREYRSRYRDESWHGQNRGPYSDHERPWGPREGEGFDRSGSRSRAPRFGRMDGGPYSGYSGFGGPGWTAGGYGDPGYNTSGFGHPDYGASRTGAMDRESTEAGWNYRAGRLDRGPFTGKAPKNYQRSDERIREEVCERLTLHGHVDPCEMEIEVQNGDVTLSGTTTDRRQKFMAEEIAEGVAGVRNIDNRIRVRRD